MDVNWDKVADYLLEAAAMVRSVAKEGFPRDLDVARDARNRAAIWEGIGSAIKHGLKKDGETP